MRGLFLDLDGTLADSLPGMRAAYAAFLTRQGAFPSDAEFDALNGPPLNVVIESLKNAHSLQGTVAELTQVFMQAVVDVYQSVRPSEGAAQAVMAAHAQGWVCAVVTSNSEKLARLWLENVELLPFIHTVVGKESIVNGKPHPEPYLLALERTGCDAHRSAAVEDSLMGLTSARGAGLRAFAYVPPPRPLAVPVGCERLTAFDGLLARLSDA